MSIGHLAWRYKKSFDTCSSSPGKVAPCNLCFMSHLIISGPGSKRWLAFLMSFHPQMPQQSKREASKSKTTAVSPAFQPEWPACSSFWVRTDSAGPSTGLSWKVAFLITLFNDSLVDFFLRMQQPLFANQCSDPCQDEDYPSTFDETDSFPKD